ncbi:hypothetical protein [Haliangium sp. UPWRP_2]|uniref:sialidase family protein n=1 Tax=Haliangium sp. UPWRP_2 TaxID=1931276 RepID=UPI000D0DBABB|nr:hypothetical protein [Haliangium sp. UPWRP_2]PSM30580.1 hypothetical protein BVG81_009785 [Haliangium sp. UPWRP_2]
MAPCAAKSLCSAVNPSNSTVQSIWALSPNDIWAVGNGGIILHFDGTSWTAKSGPIGVTENLYSVWGSGPNNIWAVGAFGRIIRYDGTTWSTVNSPTTLTLYGIWGVSPTDIWAVGDATSSAAQGTFLRYTGTSWQSVTDAGLGTGQFNAVWADNPNFIYVSGVGGLLARFNGTTWNQIQSNTTISLHAIWGTPGGLSGSSVYAVGDGGTIIRLRYAIDTQWNKVPNSGTTSTLYAISGDGNLLYAGGSGGTIVRGDPPFDNFVAQSNTALSTLFAVRTTSNGVTWAGGGGGFLGYQDARP